MSLRATPLFGVLSLAIVMAGPCHALSLRSSAPEIFLGDVRPGKIDVAGAGVRLSVENTGTETASLSVTVESPPPGKLKDGYEPLPEIGKRVVVSGASFTLEPGAKKMPDIKVAIPADRSLQGGQYQFDCLIEGRNAGGSALTLRTAVTLAVGEEDPKNDARETEESGFSVSPSKARVEGVPLGKRVAAGVGSFRTLKLANAGESELVVRMTPVRAWDESVTIEEGYAPAPNPRWLKTGPEVRVKAGAVTEAAFALEIPRQERYRGRRWAFVVAVDEAGGGRSGRTWWTLYVRTQDREDSRTP